MITGRGQHPTQIIVLALALNALVVALLLPLTSLIPIRVAPGFGVPLDGVAAADWVGSLGSTVLGLMVFVVAGGLVAARIVLMRWIRGAIGCGG